ncbi:MFS transporter [Marinomonas sp. CT5]|uniref:MFS transporter n=1 Tax=Marinomonas sp. CT5 TaxID=2066133 RepID=UPI001BAF8A23|nr:MFS transporter [Marinomonas sp. CT5]QUX97238.1 MFS transporter [Marinomonas sp. CT5]
MISTHLESPLARSSSNATIFAIVMIAAVVPALLMTGPVVAGQLAVELNMTPSSIGLLFMSENGAMSLATIPALFWLSRFNLKTVSFLCAVVFILANLASMLADTSSSLIITRIVSGLAGGSLMVICMTSASALPKPDRAYGLWVFGQLVLGAIGLAILPSLFESFGLKAFFLLMAILMALCVPLTRFLPETAPNKNQKSTTFFGGISRHAVMGLIAILLFYISLMGVWTFIGSIGAAAGITGQTSGNILAIATLFGIAGAGVATLLGGRSRFTWLLILGYGLMIASIALLFSPDGTNFSVAAFSFKFAWTFALPFILATLSKFDTNGQVMNLSNMVMGGGIAIGPMVAGLMIDKFGGFSATLSFALILALTSLLLTLVLQTKTK